MNDNVVSIFPKKKEETNERFQQLFEGGVFRRIIRITPRKRTGEELVALLVNSGTCKNRQEAERYIKDKLGRSLPYQDGKSFTLRKEMGADGSYYLEYSSPVFFVR